MPKNMEGKEKQNQQWYQIKVFVAVQSLSHVQLFTTPWTTGQDTRLPYPSISAPVCSKSCPLSQWCHPTISSSVTTAFSFCLQSFPASGSFPVSQLFTSGGQSTGASASASVLLMNLQGWFPLVLFYCIFRNTYLFAWLHRVIVVARRIF